MTKPLRVHLLSDDGELVCHAVSTQPKYTNAVELVTCGNCLVHHTVVGDRPCKLCGRTIKARATRICASCWSEAWLANHPTYRRDQMRRYMQDPDFRAQHAARQRALRSDPVKGPLLRQREREGRRKNECPISAR